MKKFKYGARIGVVALAAASLLYTSAVSLAQTGPAPVIPPDGSTITVSGGKLVANNTGCSSNCSFGGNLTVGSGLSADTAAFNLGPLGVTENQTVDISTLTGGATRNNIWQTTITGVAPTNYIYEGFYRYMDVQGDLSSASINGFHVFTFVEPIAVLNNGQNFESSMTNSGSITGTHVQYLALLNNSVNATANQVIMYSGLANNSNTTAGSIGEFDIFYCSGFTQLTGGTLPTNYYCLRNGDSNAKITTLGPVAIGTAIPNGPSSLLIKGADALATTFPFTIQDGNGNVMMRVSNGHTTNIFGTLSLGTQGSVLGSLTINNATSGNLLIQPPTGVALAGTLTLPNGASGTLISTASAPTFTSKITTLGSQAAAAGFNLTVGNVPTTPVNGDMWTTTSGIFVQIASSTQNLLASNIAATISAVYNFTSAPQASGLTGVTCTGVPAVTAVWTLGLRTTC